MKRPTWLYLAIWLCVVAALVVGVVVELIGGW